MLNTDSVRIACVLSFLSNVIGPLVATAASEESRETVPISSFLWDTEPYFLQTPDFELAAVSGMKRKSFVVVATNGVHRTANMTLFSAWHEVPGGRAFLCRVRPDGRVAFLQSATGDSIDLHVTTEGRLSDEWHSVIVTVDPRRSRSKGIIGIYFDGKPQTLRTEVDTGHPAAHSGNDSRLTIGCHFDANGRPTDTYRGFVNQFAVIADGIPPDRAEEFHRAGRPRVAHHFFRDVVLAANFDQPIYSGAYTVTDWIAGKRFVQKSANPSGYRASHWVKWLNPYGVEMPMQEDDFSTEANWWTFDDQKGASFAFNQPGLRFTIDQTGTFDPDRDSCLIVSKGCYDLAKGEIWIRVDNYTWDTHPALPLSHGGFVIHDMRNDKNYVFWTHRSMQADNLGNYRVLFGVNGRQRDFETGVAKGKDVFVRIKDRTVSWYYNKAGVLMQVWTDQTADLGRHVQIRFHARDFNIYSGPRNYGFGRIRIYRSQPSDL